MAGQAANLSGQISNLANSISAPVTLGTGTAGLLDTFGRAGKGMFGAITPAEIMKGVDPANPQSMVAAAQQLQAAGYPAEAAQLMQQAQAQGSSQRGEAQGVRQAAAHITSQKAAKVAAETAVVALKRAEEVHEMALKRGTAAERAAASAQLAAAHAAKKRTEEAAVDARNQADRIVLSKAIAESGAGYLLQGSTGMSTEDLRKAWWTSQGEDPKSMEKVISAQNAMLERVRGTVTDPEMVEQIDIEINALHAGRKYEDVMKRINSLLAPTKDRDVLGISPSLNEVDSISGAMETKYADKFSNLDNAEKFIVASKVKEKIRETNSIEAAMTAVADEYATQEKATFFGIDVPTGLGVEQKLAEWRIID